MTPSRAGSNPAIPASLKLNGFCRETQAFSNKVTQKVAKDSRCMGNSGWWLRSPTSSNCRDSQYVDCNGHESISSAIAFSGIRPACWITL